MPPRKVGRKTTAAGPSKRGREVPISHGQVFTNDIARNFYNGQLVKRSGIRERGIKSAFLTELDANIAYRGWGTFVTQPEPAILPLVREFYANARVQLTARSEIRKILVRGRMVPIDHATINRVYNLDDNEEDEYSEFLENDPDYDEILGYIAKEGSQWKRTRDRVVNFPRNVLLEESWAWHYFISAKLLPSMHVSDVSLNRAMLNFAIQKRLSINVGKIIEQSIIGFATGRLSSALGHPSLICQLCELEGVVHGDTEAKQIPLPIIDYHVMRSWRKAQSSGFNATDSDSDADPQPDRPTSDAGPSQPTAQADPRYAELQREITDLRKAHNRFERRTSRQMEYVVDVCKALVTAYQSGSTPSTSSSSMFFPAPPDVSPYQSEAENSSEESD